jgi:hypothetical protein
MRPLLVKIKRPPVNFFLSLVTFTMTLGFFAPFNIYFANVGESTALFTVLFKSIIFFTLSLTLTLFFFAILTYLVLKLIRYSRLFTSLLIITSTLLLTLAILFWLQGNLLAIRYGVINGQQILWEKYQIRVIVNGLLWLILLGASVKTRHFWSKSIPAIALTLLIMQSVNFLNQYFSLPKPYSFTTHTTDLTNLGTLSAKQNVILVILDTFQSDVFDDILKTDPQIVTKLKGFTFYPNTLGGFPTTYASVPLMLTGESYQNQEPIQDFI